MVVDWFWIGHLLLYSVLLPPPSSSFLFPASSFLLSPSSLLLAPCSFLLHPSTFLLPRPLSLLHPPSDHAVPSRGLFALPWCCAGWAGLGYDGMSCGMVGSVDSITFQSYHYSILNTEYDWKPSITVKQILLGIQDLLDNANCDDPAQRDPYQLYTCVCVCVYGVCMVCI